MGDQTNATLRRVVIALVLILVIGTAPSNAEANIFSGVGRILVGVLQVPLQTLVGTFSGPPVAGTVFGLINGTLQGLSMVAGGALELAGDGVALGKMVAPYLLPFLL